MTIPFSMASSLLESREAEHGPAGGGEAERSRARARAWWTAAILSALALRALFLLAPRVAPEVRMLRSVPDAPEYDRLAENLARNHVFSQDSVPPLRPELFRTPIYPLSIAPFHAWTRRPLVWVALFQIVLSLLSILLAGRLAHALGLPRAAAAGAACLVALSPNLAFLATKEVTETLFTLLLVADLWLFQRCLARPAARPSARLAELAAVGVGCGVLVLTRPIAVLLPVCLGAYAALARTGDQGRTWRGALVIPACAALVIFPWILRNGAQTGRYVLSTAWERNLYLYDAATVVASNEGISLGDARGKLKREALGEAHGREAPDEAHFWQGRARAGLRYILRHPFAAAKVEALGFAADFVSPISLRPLLIHCGVGLEIDQGGNRVVLQETLARVTGGRWRAAWAHLWEERLRRLPPFGRGVLAASALYQWGLLALAARGFWRARGARWLLLPILYFTLLTGPVGDARFRAPVEPLLDVAAACGLCFPYSGSRFPYSRRPLA